MKCVTNGFKRDQRKNSQLFIKVMTKTNDSLYLLNIRVQLEYLTLPLNLPHADLAGELRHGQAASLQAEGAVQGSLAAAPDVVERDLLLGGNIIRRAKDRVRVGFFFLLFFFYSPPNTEHKSSSKPFLILEFHIETHDVGPHNCASVRIAGCLPADDRKK